MKIAVSQFECDAGADFLTRHTLVDRLDPNLSVNVIVAFVRVNKPSDRCEGWATWSGGCIVVVGMGDGAAV